MSYCNTVRPFNASSNQDHPLVQQFWSVYHRINAFAEGLNHSKDSAFIAIDPIEFCIRSSNLGYEVPFICELKEKLRTSSHYRFVEVKVIISSITYKPKKCWLFAVPTPPPSGAVAQAKEAAGC